MKLLGFEIKRSDGAQDKLVSFAEPLNDDGALNVGTAVGGFYGTLFDIEGTAKTEAELVTKYRAMMMNPEIQQAVDEITNEAICVDSHQKSLELVLDDVKCSDNVKKAIIESFDEILNLLNFQKFGYDIFSKFYVDGRLNYHIIIDEENLSKGIQELRYIDPRKIRLIREIENKRIEGQISGLLKTTKNEYYIYSENGFGTQNNQSSLNQSSIAGIKIAKDSIARVTSGLLTENNSIILSHLHKTIKSLNQLRMLEDATVIYTLTRAPERRVFYIDVGDLPKAKAEQYLHDMMARHKNRVNYDTSTGEIRDERKMMCYDLSTKIPLLDGRTLELREIIEEHESGKQNWVYSVDPKNGKFYPGPVSWAGITKQNADVVKVTFDNDKSVICTPDHKFPVWGKGFIEAQHLTTEDSIIPGYRRQVSVGEAGLQYEQIYKNETRTWEFTHREVAKWKDEVGLTQTMAILEQYTESKTRLGSPEHHASIYAAAYKSKTYSAKSWKITTPTGEQELIENLSDYCRNKNLHRTNIKRKHGSCGYKAEILRNHKILSVEKLDDKITVGSMSIDDNETYHSNHTYLLDAGVYTKNTMTEDYWFPRRGGNRSTEVESLPAGNGLGDNQNLTYFQNKLYKALNVPLTRLTSETTYSFGRSSEITREEIKFAKFVNRLRTRFSGIFDSFLEKQLILKGVISPDEWDDIKINLRYDFMKDNYFEELKEMEILREKMNTLGDVDAQAGKYFSKNWIRRKVLFMSEEEIKEIDKEIEKEAKEDAAKTVNLNQDADETDKQQNINSNDDEQQ